MAGSDQSRATVRAYVSGSAARAFVTGGEDLVMITPDGAQPCAPALLANVRALCDDVVEYRLPSDEARDVAAGILDDAVRLSRCVDYVAAAIDRAQPENLRRHAARVADAFLAGKALAGAVERVFLNVPAPAEADFVGAAALVEGNRVRMLLKRVEAEQGVIKRLWERWRIMTADLPSLAARVAADEVLIRTLAVGALIQDPAATIDVADADPSLRDAVARWATTARHELELRQRYTEMRERHASRMANEEHSAVGNRADEFPRIIKATNVAIKPMSIEEAARILDDSKNDFIVFRDVKSDEVAVIYRRDDEDFGLIAPEAE